jgi:hypothetical protein
MSHADYCSGIPSLLFSIQRFTPWRDWTFDVRCSFLVFYWIKLAARATSGQAETLVLLAILSSIKRC